MKAVGIEQFGGNDRLRLLELPDPDPKPDEVLIQVKAAGVGQWDGLYRSNEIDMGLRRFPVVLGWEGAGVILKTGERITRFNPGDRVYYYDYPSDRRPQGAWAEKVCVPEQAVGKMPATLGFKEAGGLPIIAMTAYQALIEGLKIKPGDKLLITAGAGGVGSCAVQIAREIGAEAIALASEGNMGFVQSLGARAVFDYHKDFVQDLARSYPEGLDAVFNCTWSMETAGKSVLTLKRRGSFCTITSFPPELSDRSDVRSFRNDVQPNGAQLEEIARWVDQGKLKVHVQSVYPLTQAREALSEVERGHVRGKVVLDIESETRAA